MPGIKKHTVRRIGGRGYIDTRPMFTVMFEPVKIISKKALKSTMSVRGEMDCTAPYYGTDKNLRHCWEFFIKYERTPDSIKLIEFNNRDRHGPYAPFLRDIIWDAMRNVL